MILSGFGDEISPDLVEQLTTLKQNGVSHLEIRGVWNKSVVDLTEEEAAKINSITEKQGVKVSAVGSPIGKIGVNDDFEKHMELLKKTISLAKSFGTKYIRIFSYYIPEGRKPGDFRDEVMRRMREKTSLAEKEDIILLLENESGIYGNIPERCREILETVGSPNLKFTFDPANFITEGVKPFTRAYPLLEEYIEYMHIKDAKTTASGIEVTASGEGEGEIRKVLEALKNRQYNGFLSLEPHLKTAGNLPASCISKQAGMAGFTGKDLFAYACTALKNILEELGIPYE